MTLMKNYEIVSEAPYWSKIVNKKLIFISALCLLAFTKSASAVPMLTVTADHLGSGLIQYTLTGVNDLGGAVAVQITATTPHTINQIPTFFFPDAAPDGGAAADCCGRSRESQPTSSLGQAATYVKVGPGVQLNPRAPPQSPSCGLPCSSFTPTPVGFRLNPSEKCWLMLVR